MLKSSLVLLLVLVPQSVCLAWSLPSHEQLDSWLARAGGSTGSGTRWNILPGPFYTPELGPGIGGAIAGQYHPSSDDTVSQNSTLSFSGYVSATGAAGINLNNYAFFAQDTWRFFLDGSLSNTPTYYYGLGFYAGEHGDHKQKYTSRTLTLHPVIYRKLTGHTYFGLGWALDLQYAAKTDKSGPLLIENTPQGKSVFSSGVSLVLTLDDRDFVPNPRTGKLADIRLTRYTPETGSDTRFDEYTLHYSRYHSLSNKDVLAWELNGNFTRGNVPWNMLPLLGDNHRMRGYYEGRYRDRNVVSGQAELRHRLTWRHGIVGWLGAGTMAPSLHETGHRHWLPSAGIGYRFEFSPRMNVRLDYGVGRGSSGFYFQTGEAF
ncbi:BamA/TamA family outer membrane protein [Salmonella enterica subsp. enterica serovar Waycross]|nr:BamA/TamA family outer membrane protein [Salmonella enterica subsp. enterica serovar Waycross]